jgi:hypothetical protein
MSGISASLDNDMDHAHVSYIYHTIFILSEKGLAILFPCIVQKLSTHSCGFLMSYMWYTRQLLFYPYPYYGSVEMSNSSDPPSYPLLLDLSSSICSLLVVRLPTKPLLEFEFFFVSKGISSVVAVNS